jgi:hypothetical protein
LIVGATTGEHWYWYWYWDKGEGGGLGLHLRIAAKVLYKSDDKCIA